MNKKLLTLAIGAALTSAPMFANAAVTVYGVGHLSVDSLDNGNATNNSLLTLSSNSSYIGFKAEEDLGGGLKAIFGAEWQVALDNSSTSATGTGTVTYNPTLTATSSSNYSDATGIANRNVFVGLQGGFGTVRLGHYDDVLKQVGRKADLFYSEQIGENRAVTRQSRYDERLANSVNYETPSLGGAVITANYGMSNSAVETSDLTAYAVGVQFSSGPLYVGAAYKDIERSTTTSSSAMRATASYAFGFGLKLAGFYQDVSSDTATEERMTYGVGASYTIGKFVPKVQYYVADSSSNAAGVDQTNGYALTAVGVDYLFSKTTLAYLTYANMSNDTNTYNTIIGAGHANPADQTWGSGSNGNDSTAISFGMRMSF